MNTAGGNTGSEKTQCEDIRAVLFDYLTRELGAGRSDLVREHLRRCADCQAQAAEMQTTLDFLRRASREERLPERLSSDRRERVLWAWMHPVLDGIFRHHILVSIAVALLLLGLFLAMLWHKEVWRLESHEGIPVNIGHGPPPPEP
jgi:anti-sigma factor RsiW